MAELTVVSFNAHLGVGRRTRRPYDVAAVLADLDADVVGLQETWAADGRRGFHEEVAGELGYELVHRVLARFALGGRRPDTVWDGGEGDWGIAVLSRLPVRRSEVLRLGRTVADRAPRVGLSVEVDLRGAPLRFVSAHCSHRMWGTVAQQVRLRRAVVARGLETPTVVVGDFNLWGPPTERLMPPLRRAVRGRTWPAHRPHSQIDHVLVGPGIEVVEAAVGPVTPSDHRPLRVRLAVAPGSG